MRVILPDQKEQKAENMEQALFIVQAFAQYKFSDYAEMVDKLQMDINSKKQKIMPGIRPVTTEELKKINRNIEERVTDIRASTVSSDDEIPDFSLELNDDNETEKGKIWLPEPFGPQEVENLEETTYVINAFLRETMPDLIETLNNITLIEDSGKRYKVIPSVNVIELKSFLKMKNFLAIKMNAFTVLSRHFEKKAFDICPDCQEVQMDRTLSCYKCGYTRKLNQGTDKL